MKKISISYERLWLFILDRFLLSVHHVLEVVGILIRKSSSLIYFIRIDSAKCFHSVFIQFSCIWIHSAKYFYAINICTRILCKTILDNRLSRCSMRWTNILLDGKTEFKHSCHSNIKAILNLFSYGKRVLILHENNYYVTLTNVKKMLFFKYMFFFLA